ncbi:SARP family transcriptional regulator [Deinococcus maricopensis]|uniref:SARP family transcriptional regulator n=1 Tax=Deinococcus maricopensis (strain DSM 21211 / LMG 22137 / NRRL B-23946 / LB-34) TaxID=709986 RepID=E8U5I0_DEIML|nr:SARP family transcriptional regulator [Deinococcus maricopensis]ADV66319.1 SARP family transcriptional regulator [Deinococcus maricopensis DSM 21211]
MRGARHFDDGQYAQVVAELSGWMDLTPEELCLLGRAELRLGLYDPAELHLLRTHLNGVPDATVEYGEVLRVTGRAPAARDHLLRALPTLTERDAQRARHVLAQAHLDLGDTDTAITLAQAAAHGLLALAAEDDASQALVTVADATALRGDLARAERLLRLALTVLVGAPDPGPRLRGLLLLARILALRGDEPGAQATLDEMQPLLLLDGAAQARIALAVMLVEWSDLLADQPGLDARLAEARALAARAQDTRALNRLAIIHADTVSAQGDHARALRELARAPHPEDPYLWAAEGRAAMRRHDLTRAETHLRAAHGFFGQANWPLDEVRTRLDLAEAYLGAGRLDAARAELHVALPRLLRLQETRAVRALVEVHPDLLREANADPALVPYVQATLDVADAARTTGAPVRVITFGRQQVLRRTVPLPLRAAVPVLTLLALEPDRTRHELELALYPDRPPGAAASAVKLALHAIRQHLGADAVETSGPYRDKRYRLSAHLNLELDAVQYLEALRVQDVGRAFHLYGGPFLPNHEEGEWVQVRREEARIGLKSVVSSRIASYRAIGDWPRARFLCEELIRRDPDDPEPHAWLHDIARDAGDPLLLARTRAHLEEA